MEPPGLRMESGCRFSQYWRGYELGLCSKLRICLHLSHRRHANKLYRRSGRLLQTSIGAAFPRASSSQPNPPVLADCFSQQEDDREFLPGQLPPVAGGIVALGKFDALHIGHRELAVQASKAGVPFLLSFVGMAEVLGWEHRAPIVAKCDRKRVLSSWAPYCGNVIPTEFELEFANVRHLTPRQFVEKLYKELKVSGVVAGENYRFGYKAAGDAGELVRLCKEYGLGSYIVSSIMDKNQCSPDGRSKSCDLMERGQVSSTRVRYALAEGDMKYVSELLGRNHRLILAKKGNCVSNGNMFSAPKSCMLNQPPKEGVYKDCTLLVDNSVIGPCKVSIDETDVHMELYREDGAWGIPRFRDCHLLGIEFGDDGGD